MPAQIQAGGLPKALMPYAKGVHPLLDYFSLLSAFRIVGGVELSYRKGYHASQD